MTDTQTAPERVSLRQLAGLADALDAVAADTSHAGVKDACLISAQRMRSAADEIRRLREVARPVPAGVREALVDLYGALCGAHNAIGEMENWHETPEGWTGDALVKEREAAARALEKHRPTVQALEALSPAPDVDYDAWYEATKVDLLDLLAALARKETGR